MAPLLGRISVMEAARLMSNSTYISHDHALRRNSMRELGLVHKRHIDDEFLFADVSHDETMQACRNAGISQQKIFFASVFRLVHVVCKCRTAYLAAHDTVSIIP